MKITAKKIHDGHKWLAVGSTLVLDDNGTIEAILPAGTDDTVFYEGVLAPGFVNVHCHLELSHLRGQIPEHTGLVPFLQRVTMDRNGYNDEQKQIARKAAHDELLKNGVVAVGDIANTSETLNLRELDHLHFHTFIEALGFSEVNAARSFGHALHIYDQFAVAQKGQKTARQTITPHAPYSVSEPLFRAIDLHNEGGLLSIHNQETADEDEYYKTKEGGIKDLFKALGIDDTYFQPTGLSSVRSYLEWLSPSRPSIFVHNTFTQRQDVQYVMSRLREASWCLCPNANLYIEQKLPDVAMLMDEDARICIGTDSLASNIQLCVLSELVTLKNHFPVLDWETLLHWATYNGAFALQMTDVIGSIAPGKTPGILQLTGLDGSAANPLVTRIA